MTMQPAQNKTILVATTPNPLDTQKAEKNGAMQININGILTAQPSGKTQLNHLLFSIHSLPLWIKQVIFTDLRDDLEQKMSIKTLKMLDNEHSLQLWEPFLTTRGKNEVLNPSAAVPNDMTQLLKSCKNGFNVANICTESHWTLEKCCILLCETIKAGYLEPASSRIINATMRYLGNKTRLGEYLVESQRITVEDMSQALLTQDYISRAMGERTNIGEIVVRLELVDQEEVESILFLKEESSKVFNLK